MRATPLVSAERYQDAYTFSEYLEAVEKQSELWRAMYEHARVPEALLERARRIPAPVHLLALSEDWCGDAVNTLPVVARLAEALSGWELRVLERDANLDLMDAHLTNGKSRSIPVVMVLNEDFAEVGWWGPRPEELQSWVLGDGSELPGKERYREERRWYARDRGVTTLEELLTVAEAK